MIIKSMPGMIFALRLKEHRRRYEDNGKDFRRFRSFGFDGGDKRLFDGPSIQKGIPE